MYEVVFCLALQSKFPKDKNIDGLPTRKAGEPETFSSVRSMKHRKAAKSQQSSEVNKAQHSTPTPNVDSSDGPSHEGRNCIRHLCRHD